MSLRTVGNTTSISIVRPSFNASTNPSDHTVHMRLRRSYLNRRVRLQAIVHQVDSLAVTHDAHEMIATVGVAFSSDLLQNVDGNYSESGILRHDAVGVDTTTSPDTEFLMTLAKFNLSPHYLGSGNNQVGVTAQYDLGLVADLHQNLSVSVRVFLAGGQYSVEQPQVELLLTLD